MKLGIEITTGVGSEDVRTVRRLAEVARRQGHEVSIFLMADGTFHAQALRVLSDLGVHLSCCAYNAQQRGIQEVEGILWGGQYDWAQTVHDADRVVVFG